MFASERRAAERIPAQLTVRYFYLPAEGVPVTRTIDLTARGARVEAVDPYPIGAAIAFLLLARDQVVDIRGQVVHVQSVSSAPISAPYRIGLRFTHLGGTDREALSRVLEQIKKP